MRGDNIDFGFSWREKITTLSFLYQPLTYLLSTILLFSGITKIVDPILLFDNISSALNFLPRKEIILIVTILPIIEIWLGLFLVLSLYYDKLKKKRKTILISTISLFILFLCYSIYGYVSGVDNDCGCFGNIFKDDMGIEIIIRNSVLLLLSLIVIKLRK